MKMKKKAEDMEMIKRTPENFVRGNKVYILGEFDKTISSNVIPDLVDLVETMKYAKDPEIEFYINSPGGYANELISLLTLIDLARRNGIKIITYNIGVAHSCGSILAVVGDVRYMYRYADNLPHLGQVFIMPQTVEQLNRSAQHAFDWFNTIAEIYAKYTKIPKKELQKILKDDDYHMGAAECLKFGFCDEVI